MNTIYAEMSRNGFEKCDFRVGDRVKIWQKVVAADISWVSDMDKCVGKIGTVIGSSSRYHRLKIKLEGSNMFWFSWMSVTKEFVDKDKAFEVYEKVGSRFYEIESGEDVTESLEDAVKCMFREDE